MHFDPPKKQVHVNVYVRSSHEGVMSTLMMGISIGESRLFKALAVTKSTHYNDRENGLHDIESGCTNILCSIISLNVQKLKVPNRTHKTRNYILYYRIQTSDWLTITRFPSSPAANLSLSSEVHLCNILKNLNTLLV